MSGGSFDYKYFQMEWLADQIENMFENDGKYFGDTWGSEGRYEGELDRIGDASPEQREVILAEVRSLIVDLRNVAFRAKELEWYMSGDTGADTYLKRLEEGRK